MIDPLTFYGCSTRALRDETVEALLPERTHIDDLDTRQYMRLAELRHTLYFGLAGYLPEGVAQYGVLAAYPDGWQERMIDTAAPGTAATYREPNANSAGIRTAPFDVEITPETPQPGSPRIYLTPVEQSGFVQENTGEGWDITRVDAAALADAYGLSADVVAANTPPLSCPVGREETKPIPFEHDGRRGYIRVDQGESSARPYLIKASVDAAEFAQYDALLYDIAASYNNTVEVLCG